MEPIIERKGRLSDEEISSWKKDGYNVFYSEKDDITYIWKSALSEKHI